MQAFRIVVSVGDSPFPEGAVVLKRNEGEDPRQGQYLMVTPRSRGYLVRDFSGDFDSMIRENPRCKEEQLADSVWDAVLRYKNAEGGDSKKEEQEAEEGMKRALGPELTVFIYLGGIA